MKKFLSIVIFLAVGFACSFAQDGQRQSLIVKFKQGSDLANHWLASSRTGSIVEFRFITGDNSSSPYIDHSLLKALHRSRKDSYKKTSGKASNFRNIDLIARLSYQSDLSPVYVCKKLEAVDGVEYAEVEPNNQLYYSVPNDTFVPAQYYLQKVKAFDAWDLIDSTEKVVVGIVDTGIEYDHIDLASNIWRNIGEIGLDSNGLSKESNGIDDDENGYVDDFQGWDFYALGDNDPRPGHFHGTHVGGIVGAIINNDSGIAGVASNAKLMAVKVGTDSQFGTSIINGYQGILYAAAMGASVINCSWGSNSFSQAEAEIVATAIELGSLIIAASGNDSQNQKNYPASHQGVISVAATDSNDFAAGFTNYDRSVDISAPGVDIYSSVPIGDYRFANGTSMASPIVAGVAAMMRGKFKDKTAAQIGELLKANSDDIDSLNQFYAGKIGRGRVNALKALSNEHGYSIVLNSYTVGDENNDKKLDAGEKIKIDFSLLNYLDSIDDVSIKIVPSNPDVFEIIKDSLFIASLAELEVYASKVPFELKIKSEIGLDVKVEMIIEISSANKFYSEESFVLNLSPSYQTMRGNLFKVTFNSTGNMCYNDYPSNMQGEGLKFGDEADAKNLAYEAALMLGLGSKEIYNSARSDMQYVQDKSFRSKLGFEIIKPGLVSAEDGFANMYPVGKNFMPVGISVKQNVYQFNDAELNNVIIPIFTVHNQTSKLMDSVFLGIYYDWDIYSAQRNYIWWDSTNNIGFAKYVDSDTVPMIGVILLSDLPVNFFAMDNNGNNDANPGVYDGFNEQEKWRHLSSGIGRQESSITDASMVLGGGRGSISPNDSLSFAFAIIGGKSAEEIINSAKEARKKADYLGIGGNSGGKVYTKNEIASVFPNPASKSITIKLSLVDETHFDLIVIDLLGRKVKTLGKDVSLSYGKHYLNYDISDIAIGSYFIVISDGEKSNAYPLIIQE